MDYRKLRSILAPFICLAVGILERCETRLLISILELTCHLKELAFRSAILYCGLLISNAFGSVSERATFDGYVLTYIIAYGGGYPVRYGGGPRHSRLALALLYRGFYHDGHWFLSYVSSSGIHFVLTQLTQFCRYILPDYVRTAHMGPVAGVRSKSY